MVAMGIFVLFAIVGVVYLASEARWCCSPGARAAKLLLAVLYVVQLQYFSSQSFLVSSCCIDLYSCLAASVSLTRAWSLPGSPSRDCRCLVPVTVHFSLFCSLSDLLLAGGWHRFHFVSCCWNPGEVHPERPLLAAIAGFHV